MLSQKSSGKPGCYEGCRHACFNNRTHRIRDSGADIGASPLGLKVTSVAESTEGRCECQHQGHLRICVAKQRSTGGPSVSRTLRDKSYVRDTTLRLQAFGFRVVDCKFRV